MDEPQSIDDLDTPALAVDLDIIEHNIRRLQDTLQVRGIANRPHVKTHKIPEIAHMQLAAGATGITCQKLGEAEVMADAGVGDILLTYNIVGRRKLERLARLAQRARLSVALENLTAAQGISEAATAAGIQVRTLVELSTEMQRQGASSPSALVELAGVVARLPGLQFAGLMLYPSTAENAERVSETVGRLIREGLCCDVVSGGGTKAVGDIDWIPELTEFRAGTYVFNDLATVAKGAAVLSDCALCVVVTVVSRPSPDRAIVDGGTKTFSSDGGLPMGYVWDYPEARIYRMNEEHGYLDLSACPTRPEIGERLRVLPNHACGTMNMHDAAYGLRGAQVEAIWTIAARGKVQ
jgi:D-serine deaminase-like pyridoxal phosphate-dependent protein